MLLFLFVGLLVFMSLVYPHTSHAMEGVRLPEDVKTLDQFKQAMPAPKAVYYNEYSADTFVVVGAMKGSTNPSGPPAYVFDGRGTLRYWSADTGDDPDNPATRVYHRGGGRLILLDEAIRMGRDGEIQR